MCSGSSATAATTHHQEHAPQCATSSEIFPSGMAAPAPRTGHALFRHPHPRTEQLLGEQSMIETIITGLALALLTNGMRDPRPSNEDPPDDHHTSDGPTYGHTNNTGETNGRTSPDRLASLNEWM